MPNGWVHATIDLIVLGRPYFQIHQKKDEPYKTLGSKHREVNHDWYNAFGELWTFPNPFPARQTEYIKYLNSSEGADIAEEYQVSISHDVLDKNWDCLSSQDRKYWESFYIWVLFNPKILKNWAGVDVDNSRIRRLIKNRVVWEYCPETKSQYKNLFNYVKVVLKKDQILQDMLKRYS